MRYVKFLLVGMVFGIVMTKAEIVSWFRIVEMFRFESFHMYGVIGSAVTLGIIAVGLIKKWNIKTFQGEEMALSVKEKSFVRYILGGAIFGLGWAMTGACPGPMFVLVGTGAFPMLIVIGGAVLGTFLYGLLKDKLPH